jgi:hypothetical protein
VKKISSKCKYIYELNGQVPMFGRDNLVFKTINMPKRQNFDNICKDFKLKKLTYKANLSLSIINIDKV